MRPLEEGAADLAFRPPWRTFLSAHASFLFLVCRPLALHLARDRITLASATHVQKRRLFVATPSDPAGSLDGNVPPTTAWTDGQSSAMRENTMGNRLYVGNLSFNATTDSVRAAFAELGEVTDVHLVMDRETGRSRGFAFVTMGNDQSAQSAIQAMNGALLDGRPLKVNEAEARPERGGGGGGFGGGGGGRGRGGESRNRW